MKRRKLLKRVTYWAERMGVTDIKIRIRTYHDPDDGIEGAALPEPQYRRGIIRFNLASDGFREDPDTVIRHELGHLIVAMYCQAVFHVVADADTRKILNDLEDDIVTRIETMPVWDD